MSQNSIILKPADWIRPDVNMLNKQLHPNKLDTLFTQRMLFNNFTLAYFTQLKIALEAAILNDPSNDLLQYQLAIVLLQTKPTITSIQEANSLLKAIIINGQLNAYYINSAHEINKIIHTILQSKPATNGITCVNWGVYNRCPLICKGCYNIFNTDILSLESCKKIIDKLTQNGVKELIISGGDPLLWSDIISFCDYASKKGLIICIDTVGYSLTYSLAKELKEVVSFIGIPFDGINQKTVEKFRLGKKDLLEKLHHSFNFLESLNIPFRVNTVVSRYNLLQLSTMAEFLQQFKSLKCWSLYQWWDLRSNESLRLQMEISEREFDESVNQIRLLKGLPAISAKKGTDRARGTIFISSNGEVYLFDSSKTISAFILGDLTKQDFEEVIDNPFLNKQSVKFNVRTFG